MAMWEWLQNATTRYRACRAVRQWLKQNKVGARCEVSTIEKRGRIFVRVMYLGTKPPELEFYELDDDLMPQKVIDDRELRPQVWR